jgi:hypothetical protein
VETTYEPNRVVSASMPLRDLERCFDCLGARVSKKYAFREFAGSYFEQALG